MIAAFAILLLGWAIGRLVSLFIRRVGRTVRLEQRTMNTPLGRALDRPGAILNLCGMAGAFYIYFVAILAALDILGLTLFADWVGRALSYLPSLFAGLLVIVIGFAVAEFVGNRLGRTRTDGRDSSLVSKAVCIPLYLVVITVGLDTMGVDTGFLYIVFTALAVSVGLTVGIGAGTAIGFGGWPYVAANIDEWVERGHTDLIRSSSETSPDTRAGRSRTSPDTTDYRTGEDSSKN